MVQGPADLEGIGELVPEEAEPWDLNGVAVAVRFDVEDLDVEEITRFGALDVDGAGEGVEPVEVRRSHVVEGGVGTHLPVEAITRLEDDLLARLAPEDRGDIGMPAVVTRARLLRQRLRPVDADFAHGLHIASPSSGSRRRLLSMARIRPLRPVLGAEAAPRAPPPTDSTGAPTV